MNLLTIVTIVRNDKNGLEQTYKSLSKKPKWVTWTIIDGGSTDGTCQYIETISGDVSFWLSEQDSGIADAFNKGIRNSQGTYILFLNAGDCVETLFFESIKYIISDLVESSLQLGVGKVNFDGKVIGKKINYSSQKIRNYLPHQAMVIERKLFEKYGYYDLDYKLGMDYEWSLRLLQNWNSVLKFYDIVLTTMEPGGLSITNYKETFKAYHRARMKNKTISYPISSLYLNSMIFKRLIGLIVKKYFVVLLVSFNKKK